MSSLLLLRIDLAYYARYPVRNMFELHLKITNIQFITSLANQLIASFGIEIQKYYTYWLQLNLWYTGPLKSCKQWLSCINCCEHERRFGSSLGCVKVVSWRMVGGFLLSLVWRICTMMNRLNWAPKVFICPGIWIFVYLNIFLCSLTAAPPIWYVTWKVKNCCWSMSDLFYRNNNGKRILSGNMLGEPYILFLLNNFVFCLFVLTILVISQYWQTTKQKVVDVNLQKRKLVGIQFVIWSGGSWIKNNGANFFVGLHPVDPNEMVIFIHSSLGFTYIVPLIMHSQKFK